VTKWLEMDDLLAIHDQQIAALGGDRTVLDRNVLESALERPRNLDTLVSPKPDLASLAAALAFGLACGQGFLDGNKRTSLAATKEFLKENGYAIQAGADELENKWNALSVKTLNQQQLADWLRERLIAIKEPIQ
jgi:death on curing protein